eukprot:UN07082
MNKHLILLQVCYIHQDLFNKNQHLKYKIIILTKFIWFYNI